MTAQLPLHLMKLESLPSALDILRYLGEKQGAADMEEVCGALGISEIRFSKAIRRLVTTGYLSVRSDYSYELTSKGQESAEELAIFDAENDGKSRADGMIERFAYLGVPRHLVSGQSAPLIVGIASDEYQQLQAPADLVLRITGMFAQLTSQDEMLKLDNHSARLALEVMPQNYSQARIKLQVFQLSPDGEDLTSCGGMYVDVDVMAEGTNGELIAYRTPIQLKPV